MFNVYFELIEVEGVDAFLQIGLLVAAVVASPEGIFFAGQIKHSLYRKRGIYILETNRKIFFRLYWKGTSLTLAGY